MMQKKQSVSKFN